MGSKVEEEIGLTRGSGRPLISTRYYNCRFTLFKQSPAGATGFVRLWCISEVIWLHGVISTNSSQYISRQYSVYSRGRFGEQSRALGVTIDSQLSLSVRVAIIMCSSSENFAVSCGRWPWKQLKRNSSGFNFVSVLEYCRFAVWFSGNALASINVVALRQTRLVLGWVTVCGRVNHLCM